MHRLTVILTLLVTFTASAAESDPAALPDVESESAEQAMEEDAKAAENELIQLEQAAGKSFPATETAEGQQAASKPWLPEAKDFDWVQLTSGEWLKGEIKSMYKDSLEFDSDKLDLLEIDWEDVKYLKSHRKIQVNLEDHAPVTGFLQISSERVHISHDYDDEEYKRSELVSLSPAGEKELDLWTVKFTLGLNVKSGNTDQIDYTSRLSAKRRTAKSRFITDYIGNVSKTNAGEGSLVETINNHRVNSSLDIYVSRYFYYTPIQAEYYRDPFQNIDQRITAGIGIGYTVYDTSHVEWNINGGPAFTATRYISVPGTDNSRINAGALSLGTDVDAEITTTLDFIFKYNIQASKADAGGYTHHMIATLESKITGRLDVDISAIWDRIGQPRKNDEGETPTSDDYRIVIGITYTY